MKYVPYFYYKTPTVAKPLPPTATVKGTIHRLMFKLCGYNQYGLYHDDILYEWPDVAEAVRRLPKEVYNQRTWRQIQAIQLDLQRIILPREKWTKYEDDQTIGRYLTPYLEDVRREMAEKDAWIAEH